MHTTGRRRRAWLVTLVVALGFAVVPIASAAAKPLVDDYEGPETTKTERVESPDPTDPPEPAPAPAPAPAPPAPESVPAPPPIKTDPVAPPPGKEPVPSAGTPIGIDEEFVVLEVISSKWNADGTQSVTTKLETVGGTPGVQLGKIRICTIAGAVVGAVVGVYFGSHLGGPWVAAGAGLVMAFFGAIAGTAACDEGPIFQSDPAPDPNGPIQACTGHDGSTLSKTEDEESPSPSGGGGSSGGDSSGGDSSGGDSSSGGSGGDSSDGDGGSGGDSSGPDSSADDGDSSDQDDSGDDESSDEDGSDSDDGDWNDEEECTAVTVKP